MSGFVSENFHAKKSANPTTQKGTPQQSFFGNAVLVSLGTILIKPIHKEYHNIPTNKNEQ